MNKDEHWEAQNQIISEIFGILNRAGNEYDLSNIDVIGIIEFVKLKYVTDDLMSRMEEDEDEL